MPSSIRASGTDMADRSSDMRDDVALPARATSRSRWSRLLRTQPLAVAGAIFLILIALVAILAPWLGTVDPLAVAPGKRARFPSAEAWFGTDMLGRDLYSRVIYGSRVSLTVGLAVGVLAVAAGLVIGTVSGFIRWLDPIIMRIMDGLMSIPGILLAIALLAVAPGTLQNVIIAIAASQVARVARLVRGEVLRVRGNLYVEAATAAGTPTWRIMLLHVIPNILGPVIVQATFICADAMLVEAVLSFVGAGLPSSMPSWGSIMSDARALWQVRPYMIAIPAVFISLTVLAINVIGDAARDTLDPHSQKRL